MEGPVRQPPLEPGQPPGPRERFGPEGRRTTERPADRTPASFLGQAQRAFAQGRQRQGIGYLLAAATEGEQKVLDTFRWSPALKRPMLTTRWAMAIQTKLSSAEGGGPSGRDRPSARHAHAPDHRRFEEGPAPGPARHRGAGPGKKSSEQDDPVVFWRERLVDPLAEQLEIRVASGHFGGWLKENKGEGVQERRVGRHNVAMLEEADMEQLHEAALKEKVDVLLVANIRARAGRSRRTPSTILTLRIMAVGGPQELCAFKSLTSNRVEAAQKTDKGASDPADELIKEVMQYIDNHLPLVEMPNLTAKVAGGRAATLAAEKADSPLPILAELRYYQWRELLKDEDLAQCYAKLLGPRDGPNLAGGTPQQRREILLRLLSDWNAVSPEDAKPGPAREEFEPQT